jgi:hypothetical protein
MSEQETAIQQARDRISELKRQLEAHETELSPSEREVLELEIARLQAGLVGAPVKKGPWRRRDLVIGLSIALVGAVGQVLLSAGLLPLAAIRFAWVPRALIVGGVFYAFAGLLDHLPRDRRFMAVGGVLVLAGIVYLLFVAFD